MVQAVWPGALPLGSFKVQFYELIPRQYSVTARPSNALREHTDYTTVARGVLACCVNPLPFITTTCVYVCCSSFEF